MLISLSFIAIKRHSQLPLLAFRRAPFYFFSSNANGPNPSQQQQQKRLKKQTERIQRLRQKQRQEIKAFNDRVNTTKGNYSPFTAYLGLHRGKFIALGVLAAIGLLGLRIWRIAGIYEVEELESRFKQADGVKIYKYQHMGLKKKQKLAIVSEQYERNNLAEPIKYIFEVIYPIIGKQTLTPVLAQKLSTLQNRITKLFQPKTPITITPIFSEQPIVLVLPNNNILISKSLLRSTKLTQSQLQLLLLLNYQLFTQGHHIRTLSFTEIPTFWDPNSAGNTIKLRQIYSRNYKRNQILSAVDLLKYKLGIPESSQEFQQMFSNLKILNESNQSKKASGQENIYQRLYKYYIYVKIQ